MSVVIASRLFYERRRLLGYSVMPGLVPGIHACPRTPRRVDGRDRPGHDDEEISASKIQSVICEGSAASGEMSCP